MNGEQILDEVRRLTGSAWSSFDEINDAYESICRRAGLWMLRQRDETSLSFQDGKTRYRLPMERMRRLEDIAVKNTEDELEWRPLTHLDDERFDALVLANRANDGTDEKDMPESYRMSGDEIEIAPTPDGTYPVRLVYIGNPPAIERHVTPVLPGNYHRIIAKKAAVSILRDSGDPVKQSKANGLAGEVSEAMLHFAFDTAPGRNKVGLTKQRMMRT